MPDKRASVLSHAPVVILLALLCCALWGSAFAFVKAGYALFRIPAQSVAGQLLFAGMRFALAGVFVLAGTTVVRRTFPLPTKADIVPILLLALSQTTLQYAPFYMGLARATGTNSSLVQGTSAFVQVVLATLVFRQEKFAARKLTGCVLGICGIALVTLRGGTGLGSWSAAGEGLVFLSVVMGGVAACLMRRFGSGGDPLLLTGWQFLCGGLALVALGRAFGGSVSTVSPGAVSVLAYLGMLSAVAFSLWSLLLKHNPVSRVAVYRPLIPVFGVLFSMAFLHEALPPEQLPVLACALALIVAGSMVVNKQ